MGSKAGWGQGSCKDRISFKPGYEGSYGRFQVCRWLLLSWYLISHSTHGLLAQVPVPGPGIFRN